MYRIPRWTAQSLREVSERCQKYLESLPRGYQEFFRELSEKTSWRIWGGAVRDLALGFEPNDLDITWVSKDGGKIEWESGIPLNGVPLRDYADECNNLAKSSEGFRWTANHNLPKLGIDAWPWYESWFFQRVKQAGYKLKTPEKLFWEGLIESVTFDCNGAAFNPRTGEIECLDGWLAKLQDGYFDINLDNQFVGTSKLRARAYKLLDRLGLQPSRQTRAWYSNNRIEAEPPLSCLLL